MVFLLALASVPLFGVLLWLQGGSGLGETGGVQAGYSAPALASVALNIIAHLSFIQAVRLAPLSGTVPLLSLTPAFSAVLAWALLGETPSLRASTGIVLVVAGAWWLGKAGRPETSDDPEAESAIDQHPQHSQSQQSHQRSATALMALTALVWSLTIPLDKLAVERSSAPFHGLVLTAGIALGTFLVLLYQGRLGELRAVGAGKGPFVLALLASTLALSCQLFALQLVLVSVVETVKRGVGNLMAVLLGRLVFAEPFTFHKLAAAALMAVGVALILL
jgi:drug/metabolite transporter (DMT)-like permease